MSAQKRVKANVTVKKLPRIFYRINHYWQIFIRHLVYYSSFDKKSFWKGIAAGLLRAPINAANIFLTGLFVDSIVDYYQDPSHLYLAGIPIPIPVLYLVALFLGARITRILDAVYQMS